MDLAPLYDAFEAGTLSDQQQQMAASASPLCLAMHMQPDIKAYPHMRYLDGHVVALCNLQLYPDGPGEEPEVWI